ncbi:MAG: ComEC/Rec2 family competence protein [Patescibacteria group bacterium]
MPQATKWALVGLVFAALFIFRIELLLRQESGQTITELIGTTAVVEGTVADDPDVRDTSTRVTIDTGSGKLIASLPIGTEVAYGDRVEVRGKVEAPKNFETQGGREFDYQNYLRVRGISATMSFAKLLSQQNGGWSVLRGLFWIKHAFEHSLERSIPQPQAALLEGILLGERGGLSSTLLQMFVTVGLIHVVVLSGSNISIVGEGVFRALGFVPRALRYLLGGVAILLFVLMTGSGAAAVRSLIMGGIGLVARYLRRPQLALRALGVAVAAMIIWNPLFVLDSGFMLSVLATFGLITLSPWLEKKLPWVPSWPQFNLRSIAASTIAVEIYLLPALLYYSGNFSLAALPVNLLVLPWVWLVMLTGFAAGIIGLLHPMLAIVPALACDILLRAMLLITKAGASLPFVSTTITAFPLWIALAVYVPLTWAATKTARQSAPRQRPS